IWPWVSSRWTSNASRSLGLLLARAKRGKALVSCFSALYTSDSSWMNSSCSVLTLMSGSFRQTWRKSAATVARNRRRGRYREVSCGGHADREDRERVALQVPSLAGHCRGGEGRGGNSRGGRGRRRGLRRPRRAVAQVAAGPGVALGPVIEVQAVDAHPRSVRRGMHETPVADVNA